MSSVFIVVYLVRRCQLCLIVLLSLLIHFCLPCTTSCINNVSIYCLFLLMLSSVIQFTIMAFFSLLDIFLYYSAHFCSVDVRRLISQCVYSFLYFLLTKQFYAYFNFSFIAITHLLPSAINITFVLPIFLRHPLVPPLLIASEL